MKDEQIQEMLDWAEMHGDNGDDDNADKVYDQTVEIEFGNNVVYECTGDVELYRGLPCAAEVTKMVRRYFDDEGDCLETDTLALEEFPVYIRRAAEKKLVESI